MYTGYQVMSGMGAYARAARRRVHLAPVLFDLRLAIAQADDRPATVPTDPL